MSNLVFTTGANRLTSNIESTLLQIKKRKAFGELLLETDDPSLLDQPPEKDFWEGSQFDVSLSCGRLRASFGKHETCTDRTFE